jgi:hypothetical protein
MITPASIPAPVAPMIPIVSPVIPVASRMAIPFAVLGLGLRSIMLSGRPVFLSRRPVLVVFHALRMLLVLLLPMPIAKHPMRRLVVSAHVSRRSRKRRPSSHLHYLSKTRPKRIILSLILWHQTPKYKLNFYDNNFHDCSAKPLLSQQLNIQILSISCLFTSA